jgi:orotidine-5'-phosphate decarboxylase
MADGKPLYRHVADRLAQWAEPHRDARGYSFVGAVVGATYPEQLAELREALPGVPLLVPGYGSQGASARDVAGAFDSEGWGAIINNSRGITFAYQRSVYQARFGNDWQAAVEQAVHDMIDDLATNTSAGRLRELAKATR